MQFITDSLITTEPPLLEILYSDEWLIAVNKPNGIAVHASPMYKDDTVFILQTLRDQIGKKVFPTHRLDKKTSGVLLFALTEEMNSIIQKMFAANEIVKTYHALVRGHIKENGTIDYPLKNNEDKLQDAVTNFSVLQHFEINLPNAKHPTSRYTLVKLSPLTGRFHQLRKHLAHIYHPIIGDRPHGCNKHNKLWKETFGHFRMMLHATEIQFTHPITQKEISIHASYSPSFAWGMEIVRDKNIFTKSD